MLRPYPGYAFGSFRAGSRTHEYSTGKIVFTPAGLPLQFRGSGGEARNLSCAFEPTRFAEVAGLDSDWSDAQLAGAFDIRDVRITQSLSRLSQELMETGFAARYSLEAASLQLMVDLGRYFRSVRDKPTRGNLASWQLQRIREHIEHEGRLTSTVQDLARLCGIGASHLQRSFKATTGGTIHSYVESVRLGRAKSLLMETDMPLKLVAEYLGFPSLSGFSTAFSRATGQTPSSFRQCLRNSALQIERRPDGMTLTNDIRAAIGMLA